MVSSARGVQGEMRIFHDARRDGVRYIPTILPVIPPVSDFPGETGRRNEGVRQACPNYPKSKRSVWG
jgi:hypothetical protein